LRKGRSASPTTSNVTPNSTAFQNERNHLLSFFGRSVTEAHLSIINSTLEKDRDIRCQSVAELRAELKRLKRETESGKSEAHPTSASPKKPRGAASSGSQWPVQPL